MVYRTYLYIAGGVVVGVLALVGIWVLVSQPSAPASSQPGTSFGLGSSISVPGTGNTQANTNQPVNLSGSSGQTIFKIVDGPVAGATFIQTSRPTTTLARYILQENGHVLDVLVDSPGAVPKAISNTTIPGIVRAWWVKGGSGLIGQYIDGTKVKSVYLGLPAPGATTTQPIKIQFLPDNIADLAPSPDGKQIVYLVRATAGINGYLAAADGSAGKLLFSFPLSQVLISWPSQSTLLLQSKSGVGVPGGAFSVSVATGAITPLVYASGLTASANLSFSNVLYQTADTSSVRRTYVHDTKTNKDTPLSFDPFPEQCIWERSQTTVALCAAPLQYVAANFLDLWHQGASSAADSIISFNTAVGTSTILATPGGASGGASSDIAEMVLSQDEHYLSFITRGDRALWGVRLSAQAITQ